MADDVTDSPGGRRAAGPCVALLLALVICFLVGGLVAPEPNSSQSILGTICVDQQGDPHRWFQVWSVTGSDERCNRRDTLQDLLVSGAEPDQAVFAFQMPLRRGMVLDFSRWQQKLFGVIQLDIDYDEYEMPSNVTLMLDVRLGYKNRGDSTDDWNLLAASVEERHLRCNLDPWHRYRYNCDLFPLFELGSLHHDFYLLNVRLPPSMESQRNVGIEKLLDIHLAVIFQNGGFTKVWLSLKAVFFPLVVALLVWFWRRVKALQREAALVECMLLALGVSISVLNLPLEFLTLRFDMPYMPLITDIRQDIFYAVLLSFCLVLAGEQFEVCLHSRLSAYWKHLAAVTFGCVSLAIFDGFERGMPLTSPFSLIWSTPTAADLAMGFIIYISVLAALYLCWLLWMTLRVFRAAQWRPVPALQSANGLQHHDEGIYRSRILMLASLAMLAWAALTVIGFVVGRLESGKWKWNADITLDYTSVLLVGVYGMWNVFTMAVLFLYAPTGGIRKPEALIDNGRPIENT